MSDRYNGKVGGGSGCRWRWLMLPLMICWGLGSVQAQTTPVADSVSSTLDSTKVITDSVSLYQGKSEFKTTVHYQAKDSMVFDVRNQMLKMYREGEVKYDDKELSAGAIDINMAENNVTAKGVLDTSTNRLTELAVFIDGGQEFQADSMKYNFISGKGIISNAVTQQGEGFLKIDTAKKMIDGSIYGRHGSYTTCNLEHPHYAIRTSKIKAMPDKYVVSGPFNLEINSIPTPLGFLFGIFPSPNQKVSGIIIPTYGEQRDRGFFLRDGGVYWAINDYVDAKVLGQIYTLGGWGVTLQSSYKKRYAFGGSSSIRFNKVVQELDDLSKSASNEFWVQWSHRPISRGAGKLSASVNFGTRTFNTTSARSPQEYLSASFTSNISYSNSLPNTPFSMAVSLRHNQNTQTGVTNISPQGNLTMKRIFPFRKTGSSKKNILTQLGLSYTMTTQTKITNAPQSSYSFGFPHEAPSRRLDTLDFNIDNMAQMLDEMSFGFKHSIPVSTTVTLFKNFQIPMSLRYEEVWYPKRLEFTLQGDNNRRVGEDTLAVATFQNGFSRASNYSMSTGINTRFYVFYKMKGKKIDRIRHQVTPSVNFSYTPDFSSDGYNSYDNFLLKSENSDGEEVTTSYSESRYQGSDFVYGGPRSGRAGSIGFSLGNQLEMKVYEYNDTTDEPTTKKITLIRNMSISSSYNLLADSFNLSNIRINAATTLFEKVTINGGATIDPYYYSGDVYNEEGALSETGRKRPGYAWNNGQGIGRVSNANLAFSTNFKPKGSKTEEMEDNPELTEQERREVRFINDNPEMYVDFNVPWSLNLNYTFNYRKSGLNPSTVTQTVNFSGDISLTEKWKFGFSSGYDFDKGSFSFSSLNVYRDLHCWQMSLNWVPFGQFQSYSIDIKAKSTLLQDLKISKRNQWFDR